MINTDKKDGKEKKYYHTLTYGCQMNEHDTETIAGIVQSMGYEHTDDLCKADLILINTCCVRESAELKIYGKIGELKALKQKKPELLIGVGGCMVQKDKEMVIKRAPHVDFIFGTHNLHELAKIIEEAKAADQHVVAIWEKERELCCDDVPVVRKDGVKAWVTITYGCNNFCSYCIVPYVRGRERSRPPGEIIREVEVLGREGYKEVTLLGQNVNSYGKDFTAPMDFADLLQKIDKVPGIERIRYMTSHPRDVSEKLVTTIKNSRKVCEHFHLPIQAGSDAILAKMNRGYTTDDYRILVKRIRELIPGASLTTDLIVGFPGETEAHFQETLALVKEIRFDAAYTFLYSPRSGTPAADMPNQVSLEVKKERLKQLMDVQNKISREINEELRNKTVEILVEGKSRNNPEMMTGRTRTNKIVIFAGDQKLEGKLVNVKITEPRTWTLFGELV